MMAAILIERHHLAVDDRLIRHGCKRLYDAGIARIEIVIIPRAEMHLALS